MHRKILAISFAVAAFALPGLAQTPNLSGAWKLNLSKSDFGQIPPPASEVQTIVDNEPSLSITTDQKGGMAGDTTTVMKLTTDGKEVSWQSGGNDVKSTAKWQGQSLVILSNTTFQGSDIGIKGTYTLGADGKTLTIAVQYVTGMGNFDLTALYDKTDASAATAAPAAAAPHAMSMSQSGGSTSKLSGTWTLNVSKSDFGQLPPPVSETDTIAVSGNDFKQQVASVTQRGSQNYVRGCTADGKEVTLASGDPRANLGAITVSKVQCAWQGSSLVYTETADLRGTGLVDKLTFSASDDGKTLTMTSNITSAAFNADRKLVYDQGAGSAAMAAPAAAAAPATAAMSHAGGTPPNLSGTWKLSLTKSDFGQIPGPVSQIDTIEHNEPTVKIAVNQKGGMMGDTSYESAVTTDGKPSTSSGMAGSMVTSTAHWDGAALVVDSSTSFQGTDVKIKDHFTLSDDGKTLTEVTRIESGMGNFDETQVYDKQ